MTRASWDQTWMAVADAVALRSFCVRAQCGAVVVDASNRVVATGYNGWPAQMVSGLDCANSIVDPDYPIRFTTCPRATDGPADAHSYLDCYSVHAEANALLFCDRRDREGGTIYVSTNVCWECAKLVANSGLARVVMRVDRNYRPVDATHNVLRSSQIEVVTWTA